MAGPAVDMDGLREAVGQASAGTGEVRRAITSATFQPRAAAFTSLIQQCARAKNWQKALEVFETMKEYPAVKVAAQPSKSCQDACSCAAAELRYLHFRGLPIDMKCRRFCVAAQLGLWKCFGGI